MVEMQASVTPYRLASVTLDSVEARMATTSASEIFCSHGRDLGYRPFCAQSRLLSPCVPRAR